MQPQIKAQDAGENRVTLDDTTNKGTAASVKRGT